MRGQHWKGRRHLELPLATAEKDAMQCSYQYAGTTQRAREILPPLLDVGRDIATEEEE